jgi:hypothetical protein
VSFPFLAHGFAKPLTPEKIEQLTMKWHEGTVYLCGEKGNIPITDGPKSKYQAPTQSKVVINHNN